MNENTNSGVSMEALQNMEVENYKKLNPNSFPFWVFPKVLQDVVLEGKRAQGFPVDFFAAAMFCACGIANGQATKAKINGYNTISLFWMAMVGEPGTNKSSPVSWAMRPIENRDDASYIDYKNNMKEWDDSPSDQKGSRPVWRKYITSDTTIEGLAYYHQYNKRGISVYSEEIDSWAGSLGGRYKNGSDVSQWLSMWNGTRIQVDRKTSMSVLVPESFVSVIGTIQPRILFDVINGKNSSNGFSDRLLCVMPDDLRKPKLSDSQISELAVKNYTNILTNIMDFPAEPNFFGKVDSNVIRCSSESNIILNKWLDMNRERFNEHIKDRIGGVYSKFDIYVCRFALTLQIIIDACKGIKPNQIGVEAVQGAIEIVEYFVRQAEKVHVQFKKKDYLDQDFKNKDLFNGLPDVFETKQALDIARELRISERKMKMMLSEGILFKKVAHGKYQKK